MTEHEGTPVTKAMRVFAVIDPSLEKHIEDIDNNLEFITLHQGDDIADLQRDINRILVHLGLDVRHVPPPIMHEFTCQADLDDHQKAHQVVPFKRKS